MQLAENIPETRHWLFAIRFFPFFMQMSHSGCNAGKYLKRYVPLPLYAAAAVVTVTDTML